SARWPPQRTAAGSTRATAGLSILPGRPSIRFGPISTRQCSRVSLTRIEIKSRGDRIMEKSAVFAAEKASQARERGPQSGERLLDYAYEIAVRAKAREVL